MLSLLRTSDVITNVLNLLAASTESYFATTSALESAGYSTKAAIQTALSHLVLADALWETLLNFAVSEVR